MMTSGERLPAPTLDALRAHQALTDDLHQWAPTVHQLVKERIAALVAAYGPYDALDETAEEYAARVFAGGQRPFPAGVSIYENLNDNRGYDHVAVRLGLPDESGLRITYTGWYPRWVIVNDDTEEEAYERRPVEIHVPAWLVTDPDGVEKYRQETDAMAAAVRAAEARLDDAIEATIAKARASVEGKS
jgi:hypothetical protein